MIRSIGSVRPPRIPSFDFAVYYSTTLRDSIWTAAQRRSSGTASAAPLLLLAARGTRRFGRDRVPAVNPPPRRLPAPLTTSLRSSPSRTRCGQTKCRLTMLVTGRERAAGRRPCADSINAVGRPRALNPAELAANWPNLSSRNTAWVSCYFQRFSGVRSIMQYRLPCRRSRVRAPSAALGKAPLRRGFLVLKITSAATSRGISCGSFRIRSSWPSRRGPHLLRPHQPQPSAGRARAR